MSETPEFDLAKAQASSPPKPLLDFVRAKFAKLKSENQKLKNHIDDLSQELQDLRQAHQFALGKQMTADQQQIYKEVSLLLQQARVAKKQIAEAKRLQESPATHNLLLVLRSERERRQILRGTLRRAAEQGKQVIAERNEARLKLDLALKEYNGKLLEMQRKLDSSVVDVSKLAKFNALSDQILKEIAELETHFKTHEH